MNHLIFEKLIKHTVIISIVAYFDEAFVDLKKFNRSLKQTNRKKMIDLRRIYEVTLKTAQGKTVVCTNKVTTSLESPYLS